MSTYSPSSSSLETPPRKLQSLREIYDSCDFALYVSNSFSYDEVVDSQEWLDAMEEEIFSIKKNETWEFVDLPEVLGSSEFTKQSIMMMALYRNTKHVWWQKGTLNSKALTLKKLSHQWLALKL